MPNAHAFQAKSAEGCKQREKNGGVEWVSKKDMRFEVKIFVNGFRLFVTTFRAMCQQNGM